MLIKPMIQLQDYHYNIDDVDDMAYGLKQCGNTILESIGLELDRGKYRSN